PSAQVHATVATLLDRCPPQLHLMLITRADPPLPLSRLRVRGDLAELRAEDLRFSAAEAVEFFSSRLGALLSEQDVLRLLARTEGWAAGLQLAALRLRDRPDRSDFIERLTGADWHIVNYLGEEVLATQPADGRDGRLAAAHWRQPFNAGQLETVRMWLDALPAELVSADASLSAARVWVALDTGRLEEVGAALDAAETSVPRDIQLMVLRALQLYKAGDVGGAAARLREITRSADDPFIATVHRLVQ